MTVLNAIKNQKKKALVIIGVSTVLVIACAGVTWMDYGTIAEEELQIADLQRKNGDADRKIAEIKPIEDRVLLQRVNVKRAAQILPEEKDINTLVSRITDFAAQSGVIPLKLDDRQQAARGRTKSPDPFERFSYKVELKGSLDQFLGFMQLFETYDRFVSVREFTIASETRNKGDATEVPRHKISMEVESYIYTPSNQQRVPVEIVAAEKRTLDLVEKGLTTDELELEFYDYVQKEDRRDPLVNPRRPEQTEDLPDVAENLEEQQRTFDDLLALLTKMQAMVADEAKEEDIIKRAELARVIDTDMNELFTRLRDFEKQQYFTDLDVARRVKDEIADPFGLLAKARPPMAKIDYRLQDLESQIEAMGRAFDERRYKWVASSSETLLASKPENPEAAYAEIYGKIEAIAHRARARLDFELVSLKFSGLVFRPDDPQRAVVIINNRAFSPGDVMDDGIVVTSIGPSRISFSYKGEKIDRNLD